MNVLRYTAMLSVVVALGSAAAQEGGSPTTALALRAVTIDGGGVSSAAGGSYTLAATLGQPDTGLSLGGIYALQGGFQPVAGHTFFADGFESGDTSAWSAAVAGRVDVRASAFVRVRGHFVPSIQIGRTVE